MRDMRKGMRQLFAGLLIVVMAFTSIAQADPMLAASKTKVKSIKILKPAIRTLALKRGEKYKLKLEVSPKKSANKVQFSSTKKSVAVVSKKGIIKAKKAGKTTIIISSRTTPKKRIRIQVNVYNKLKKVKKVSLNETTAVLHEGEQLSLKATISPKRATVKKVTYMTSQKSVVTVNQKGIVTAKKAGTAQITVYAKDGRGAKAVCHVTVKKQEVNKSGTPTVAGGGKTAAPTKLGTTPSTGNSPTPSDETPVSPPASPSTTPGETDVPVEKSELPKLTWNCLGDSITANAYVNHHYYDYITDRNPKVQVNNYGISGTKLAGIASGAFCNRYTEMQDADVITVFGGVNDWGQRTNGGPTPLGKKSDTTNKTFYGALNILCAGLQEKYPDAVIIFMTPLGNDGYSGFSTKKNSLGFTVEDYVNVICEVCESYSIPVVDLYRESGISPYDSVQNSVYFHDGLHLNNRGHERISYLIENAIWKYFCNKQTDKIEDEKVVDLMMFMGQSNMAGRGVTNSTWTEEAPKIREGAGYEFRAVSDPVKLYEMAEPFGINENSSSGIHDGTKKTGSMVTAFTNAYSKYTGVPIVGVSASEGGTSIEQWQPEGKRLTDAISRYRAAVTYLEEKGYTIRHRYMLWCQGESDGDKAMDAGTYQSYFDKMLDKMKSEKIEKCYMVRIGKYNGSDTSIDYSGIIEAQTELAETNPDVIMVSKDMAGLKARKLMKDAYHYYQKAYNEVGTQAGGMAAYYVLTGSEPLLYDPKDDTAVEKPEATPHPTAAPIIEQPYEDKFVVASDDKAAPVYVDEKGEDYDGLSLIAESFAGDVAMVTDTGLYSQIITKKEELGSSAIIAGSIGNNDIIDSLIQEGKLDVSSIKGKWETYQIQVVENPTTGVEKAVVVVGSDKRGTIYGIYHISEMMGVSPWVYWGDATPEIKREIVLSDNDLTMTSKEPSVKYRGIFLNDEAPSLTGWVKNKYGNYNEDFYQLVYELILRCKGNYLWPAMWSNVFSEDGESSPIANAELADRYGIVMGTSHHEPLCRAGEEWQDIYSKYGSSNLWDFNKNGDAITKFWEDGVKRNRAFENIYTLGMRGEADSSLGGSVEENINLLKNVITAQKKILADNDLSDAPQVLTVYKEVENYWHGTNETAGLKNWDVLDDVTIMLCDDNFGNLRTLPTTKEEQERKGGWGMYYHFDYHGGPTSYEWMNTVELNKVWEQMSMAYEHGIDDIWIVNVGDLKPMEMNISYFLDMAYDYETWGQNGLNKTEDYMTQWINKQFGEALNEEEIQGVVSLLEDYTWLNGSCKPEVLNRSTYHVTNYNEAMEMLGKIEQMMNKAETFREVIPQNLQAAYFELVYFPVVASANVARIQIYSGLNEYYYDAGSTSANLYAVLLKEAIQYDQDLEYTYNSDMPGVGDKWKYMMSSPHVGFVTWNSTGWSYPEAKWYKPSEDAQMMISLQNKSDVYVTGEAELDDFTSINQESYTVTVSNGGGQSFAYTAKPSADWIKVSKTSGYVTMQDTLEVSVDWSKVQADTSGTITITGADHTVTLSVRARVYDVSDLENKTYVYANGYASILASNFVASGDAADGGSCKVIEKYGKMGQAVKAFPSTVSYADNPENAPYVEYKVNVDMEGTYKLTVYTAPSNNVDREDVNIRYGLSVNGSDTEVIRTINSANYSPGAYSGTWTTDVKANGRKTVSDISLSAGTNTIRIYAIDPTLLLQKLVVSREEVSASHLGPSESYFVGEKLSGKTALTGLPGQRFSLPGIIDANAFEGNKNTGDTILEAAKGNEYSYPAIVTEENTYQFSISAKSESGAQIKLLWNEKTIGTMDIGEEDSIYEMDADINLTPGAGTLRMIVEDGSADIEYIKVKIKEAAGSSDVFISASSEQTGHEAVLAYDKESKTTWMPQESDEEKWIAFDFDEEYYFDRFAITQSGNGVSGYKVQVYNGKEWKTVYTGTDISNGATVFMQGKEVVKGQKVRFVWEGTDVKIGEISITPYINWALEDHVTLRGEKNSGESISVPDSIIDGNRITKGMEASVGSSSDANRHLVTMEFEQPRTIDTVRVVSLQSSEASSVGSGSIPDLNMTSDRAQYSYRASYYDGSAWKEIGATLRPSNGNPKVFSEFTLDKPVAAQAVRLEIYTSNWIRINELEAVQTQRFRAAVSDASREFSQENTQFDVELSDEITVGRIVIDGAYDEFTFAYYDSDSSSYVEIAEKDMDIIKTSTGCYGIPANEIKSRAVRVTAEKPVSIHSISVYEAAKREEIATEEYLYQETFENGAGTLGTWGGAGIEATKAEAYEGEKSLLVTNRTDDWSAPTLNIGSILGTADSETEYTLSFYVKTASDSKTLPVLVKICNQEGNDLEQSPVTQLAAGKWTYVEYKFRMKNSGYKYLKIQTEGDTKDANNKMTSYYLDNIAVTIPLEDCKCALQRPVVKNSEAVVIPVGKTSKKIDLQAEAEYGECHTYGHENGSISFHYSLADNSEGIAVLEGNSLRFIDAGTAVVRVRAELNGYVRYGMKSFTVTKATEVSETYKNYAAAENGGTVVVPSGGEGVAGNLNDGDRYTTSKRWRTKTSPAYVEVYFDGVKDIDTVYFYSQQEDGNVSADITDDMTSKLAQKNLVFSYMKDGRWVTFEGGTITNNDKVKCGICLEDAVKTPAVRIDITGTVSSYIRAVEVEAYGDASYSDECICQLGVPKITSQTTVEIDKDTSLGTLELMAETVSYSAGCTVEGHRDKKPVISYSIVEDLGNIAKLEGNTLSVSNMGTVRIKVTAELNGIRKSTEQEITAVKAGYVNFALAENGSKARCSDNYDTTTSPDHIIDGNNSFSNGKRWRTSSFPAYVEVDFGQSRTIDLISLFSQQDANNFTPTAGMTGKYALPNMTFSYWDEEKGEWKELETISDNTKIWYQLKLDQSVTTSKIRVDIPKGTDGWARVVEVEAWGYKE